MNEKELKERTKQFALRMDANERKLKELIRKGAMQDFFPYPDSLRFCNAVGGGQLV